ncbi:hypothetical protein D3C81_1972100 [compost metagenome]
MELLTSFLNAAIWALLASSKLWPLASLASKALISLSPIFTEATVPAGAFTTS